MKKNHRHLLLLLTILIKYATSTSTSIAEEINFQVSSMKESAIQAAQDNSYAETMENDQDENVEDIETSPSEIVETRALPETMDTADDLTAEQPPPRRRRRRRRRKRPKPTVNPIEDGLDAYYTLPEEEIQRKPIKYRPPENVEQPLSMVSSETAAAAAAAAAATDTFPRRRLTKRRRRPFKRPIDDYPSSDTGGDDFSSDYTAIAAPLDTSTAAAATIADNNARQFLTEYYNNANRNTQKSEKRNESDTSSSVRGEETDSNSPSAPTSKALPALSNRTKQLSRIKSVFESSKFAPKDSNNPLKKRKPHTVQHSPFENNAAAATTAPEKYEKEQQEQRENEPVKMRQQSPLPQRQLTLPEQAFNAEIQSRKNKNATAAVPTAAQTSASDDSYKVKSEESSKARQELFKLRRLPPTSAILRNVKIRPFAVRNETLIAVASAPSTKYEIDAVGSDESFAEHNRTDTVSSHRVHRPSSPNAKINDTVAFATDLGEIVDENVDAHSVAAAAAAAAATATTTTTTEKQIEETRSPPPPPPSLQGKIESFEFPIIAYTEQKQTGKIANHSAPPSSTERAAVIYIACNRTVDERLLKVATVAVTSQNSSLANDATLTTREPENKIATTVSFSKRSEANGNGNGTNDGVESITARNIARNEKPANYTDDVFEKLSTVAAASSLYSREAKHYENNVATTKSKSYLPKEDPSTHIRKTYPSLNGSFVKPFTGSSKELIISYTSTTSSLLTNDVQPQPQPQPEHDNLLRRIGNELSLRLKNYSVNETSPSASSLPHKNNTYGYNNKQQQQQQQQHSERKKLPLAVKSAIIISGAILALAVLGFFALLLSCKIRQAKSRMKCHQELYRDQFRNSEFRQSSRSTSPVMSKSSNYNGRHFAANTTINTSSHSHNHRNNNSNNIDIDSVNNNIHTNVESNRNYYLWQTLRKTFQYD